jgi:hypothetical protein
MGLFGKKFEDPVRGVAQVVAASIPPRGVSGSANCNLELVITAEGMEPYATSMTSWRTPTSKWPYSGYTLPVTVDRADPDHVKIEWDEVPSGDELVAAEAERLAEAMRSGAGSGHPEVPPEAAAIVQQLAQMFPGASVTVNEPIELGLANVSAGAARGGDDDGDDRISQLERLAKLREQGMLSETEFQAEKARIVGG